MATSKQRPDSRPGNHLSSAERVRRNRQVIADRLEGLSWASISARHGLKERQLRNIYRDWQKAGAVDLAEEDPIEMTFELIERYRRVESDLAHVAANADNSAARVGAHKARLEAIDRQVNLLQASGLLPRHLGQLRVDADIQMVAARIVSVFREHRVPQEARDAVIAAISAENS